jgi:cytochrome P450
VVGVLPYMFQDPLDYFLSARNKSGDIFTVDLGVTQFIALNHPRHVQHVFRDNARNYRKGGAIWDTIRKITGNGLPVSEGDFWLRQRRMIQPHFGRERLNSLFKLMLEAIDESMKSWEQAATTGEPLEAYREFAHLAMNVVVKTLFGADITREETDIMAQEFDYLVTHVLVSMFTQSLPRWMPMPGRRRFEQALQSMDKVMYELIARRRRKGTNTGQDILGMLIDAVDSETNTRMTDQQLRDEALSLFLAGYETTSTTLAFTCACLAKHPDILRTVQEECAQVDQRTLGVMDLCRQPVLNMALQETLRQYSSTFWVPRTAIQDDVIDGFRIPAGSMVGIITYVIHRHPDIWEEPEKFDPWRFSPERSAGRHPLAWLPFGAGQRLCVGKDFALMEAQLTLNRLMSRFDFELVPGHSLDLKLGATIRPKNGVWLRVRNRTPSTVAAVG